MPTYLIKKGSGIAEGGHTGKIIALDENERGEKKYKYIDVIMKIDGTDKELKYGCPAPKNGIINPKSNIGKLIALFVELKEDESVNPEDILVGKELKFQTIDNENGFTEILEKTIKKN